MERLLKNQQIPLVQVIDPISGQQYYAPESAIYTTSTDSNPVVLKNVTVDQANSASYFSGSITNAVSSSYALTASYLDRPVVSASYAFTASFITASNVYGPFGSNSIISASYATTSSISLAATANIILVLNQSGNTIAKGVVVHITASGNSSDIPRIITASYENDNNSANTLGISAESIANGSTGYVTTEGVLPGINTSAFTSGQLVYLGSAGSITGSAPLAPLHSVRLGQVVREQAINGSIYVRVDNGYELGELHDVRDFTTTSSYGDLLVKSGSVWINSKQLTGSYVITGSLTISGSSTFTNIGPAIFSGSVASTSGFTGSFQGTASSAVYSLNSDRAISSSYAFSSTSASFASTASIIPSYEGTWISYTPVWTAASVNPVIGNGSLQGWYKVIGKTCFVRGNIVIGSSTTFGSGEWYVSMPFTASHADAILMTANLLDNGSAWYNAVLNGARAGFNFKTAIQYQSTGGTALDVNATQPFTWANSDRFLWNGSFEIA